MISSLSPNSLNLISTNLEFCLSVGLIKGFDWIKGSGLFLNFHFMMNNFIIVDRDSILLSEQPCPSRRIIWSMKPTSLEYRSGNEDCVTRRDDVQFSDIVVL